MTRSSLTPHVIAWSSSSLLRPCTESPVVATMKAWEAAAVLAWCAWKTSMNWRDPFKHWVVRSPHVQHIERMISQGFKTWRQYPFFIYSIFGLFFSTRFQTNQPECTTVAYKVTDFSWYGIVRWMRPNTFIWIGDSVDLFCSNIHTCFTLSSLNISFCIILGLKVTLIKIFQSHMFKSTRFAPFCGYQTKVSILKPMWLFHLSRPLLMCTITQISELLVWNLLFPFKTWNLSHLQPSVWPSYR